MKAVPATARRWRCTRMTRAHAATLWTELVELALRVAAAGGDRTRAALLQDFRGRPFRLAGERHHTSARRRLTEASENALADIADTVGGAVLLRHERLAEIRAALDTGRYVEIRGTSGVGKSGLLKHLARQVSTESPIIVLSPVRTTPRGWSHMRAVLDFDGTAQELLADLAGSGGATLFIDNLNRFAEDERLTVIDLVRAASTVSGVSVVATARDGFGIDEPNWLPGDALDRLVRAAPISIGELSDAEIDELRYAAPQLVPLLAHGHPAQQVTRNLFRLARLAAVGAGDSPRTEVDMVRQWWGTADGPDDERRRERGRVLRAVADGALAGAGTVNVDSLPPAAVDVLVRSESLRDFGNDRVAFRHDVLAEWAVSCLLSDLGVFDRLPLQSPAPAILARGVELAARFAIERSADSASWEQLFERVSREGVHGSWRRAALLALVRSETAAVALSRASEPLLANHARLLRELSRTVKAVDVLPASQLFAALGVDPAAVPPHINTPHGPAWFRLIMWLLALGDRLPAAAIPDAASLYFDWSLSIWGRDPLTPLLLPWVHQWLSAIEDARETDSARGYRAPLAGDLDGANLSDLEDNLRTGFVAFCDRTPALAASHLEAVMGRRRNERAVEAILKLRGRLAEAAPAQLAALTATALIPPSAGQDGRGRHHGSRRDNEPFTWTDTQFIPASPAQGPFLELLTHAPQHGLALIRQLVDQAIAFYSDGQPHGSNAVVVQFPDGPRTFPWVQSYNWSREGGGRSFAVQSALMALEAWAHKRIEAGEAFDRVLADVVGAGDAPAAHLLVAVDVVLSHWPASRNAAVPFLGCPELLAIDRQRWSHDVTPVPDIFGLDNLQREPRGLATLESLKQRPSRRAMLDERLPDLAVEGPEDVRQSVAQLLREAATRLGPYGEDDDLGDAAFMAAHASNLLVPENYTDVEVRLRDGRTAVAKQYLAPEAERRHMERLRSVRDGRSTGVNFQLAISAALEDRRRSSHQFAERAAEWAERAAPPADEENDSGLQQQAVVGAAMIAMRDLTGEQRARYRPWAMSAFDAALQGEDDPVTRVRKGLKFNPLAIAFAGTAFAMADGAAREQAAKLLAFVHRPAAAHGFIASASVVAAGNNRLPQAIVRCALRASIYATRHWDERDEDRAVRVEQHRRAVDAAIETEQGWLYDGREEPPWPILPGARPRTRTGIRIAPGGHEDGFAAVTDRDAEIDRFDYQAAAAWLRGVDADRDRVWLPAVLRACADWTWAANGAGLESSDDLSDNPDEWNDVYLALLAHDLAGADDAAVERLALEPLASLPDKSFFDGLTRFQRSIDVVHFNNLGLDTASAIRIRARLAERLRASNSWRWMLRRRSSGVEMHLGPAIATLFLNDYGWTQPAKAYLPPALIERLTPFLPTLETCAVEGATYFVAIVTLNLLEVAPRATHLSFLLAAATSWMAAFPDATDFWIEHGIGRRVCVLIEAIRRQDVALLGSGEPLRDVADRLLPALTRVGVPEAARLEQDLADR